jgi:hypothetical protein
MCHHSPLTTGCCRANFVCKDAAGKGCTTRQSLSVSPSINDVSAVKSDPCPSPNMGSNGSLPWTNADTILTQSPVEFPLLALGPNGHQISYRHEAWHPLADRRTITNVIYYSYGICGRALRDPELPYQSMNGGTSHYYFVLWTSWGHMRLGGPTRVPSVDDGPGFEICEASYSESRERY